MKKHEKKPKNLLVRVGINYMKKIFKIKLRPKPHIKEVLFNLDAYEVFSRIESRFENCFLFESLTEGNQSRYTILGFEPDYIVRANGKKLTIDDETFQVQNPYEALRTLIPQDILSRNFAGGLVGYMSYESAEYFEPNLTLKHSTLFDQFCFGLYTDGFVFDNVTGEIHYFYYKKSRLSTIKKIVNSGTRPKKSARVDFAGHTATEEEHAKIVSLIQKEIAVGNTFQCQAGIRASYQISGSPLAIYEELRSKSPAPFMYYLKFGKKVLLGASPELLFEIINGEMKTCPLAGTIRRGETAENDRILARKLINDKKELAEHLMLVDLHRNDIGKVARFGSVKVHRLLDIKKFSHVQHLGSEITGLVALGHDMFSALGASFPAGTLTGTPKVESMKIIDRNEKSGRGPYGGAVGFFGFNGNCTFTIAIRSLFVSGKNLYAQASGGIVYDSSAKNEYEEIMNKLAGVDSVLKKFTKI